MFWCCVSTYPPAGVLSDDRKKKKKKKITPTDILLTKPPAQCYSAQNKDASLRSNMSKHTPGPWTTYRTKTGGWLVYAPNGIKNPCPEGQLIANCGVTALAATLEELNANTDLIAAAPEMLEALKLIIKEKAPSYHDCLDNGEPECEWCIAMNAIAKAEGKL